MPEKSNLLFVDDNPNLISGLKRVLYPMRDQWVCQFTESAGKALEIMESAKIDLVVSDMKMPGMDGAEFLKIVRDKHPNAVRIVLSGHSDQEMSLRSTRVAHQFLSKPYDSQNLIQTIKKILKNRELLGNDKISDLVSGMNELPALPETYLELEKILFSENISMNKIVSVISKDISMTAKILQMVNTAFFGLPVKINNTLQAVNYLGVNIIKSLVLYVKIFDWVEDTPATKKFINDVWQHSLKVAKICSELVSGKLNNKHLEEEIYIAGLLHDIGKIILLKYPSYFENVHNLMEKKELSYFAAEMDCIGVSHSQVGAYLLQLWGLQEEVVSAVYNHHTYDFTGSEINAERSVFIANYISTNFEGDDEYIKRNSTGCNDYSWFKLNS